MKIIYPPKIIKIDDPIIFLAGPIRHTYDWQSKIALYFKYTVSEYVFANPRLVRTNFNLDEQIDWETYYLNQSAKTGYIAFYLAAQTTEDKEESFARTTRFELGE